MSSIGRLSKTRGRCPNCGVLVGIRNGRNLYCSKDECQKASDKTYTKRTRLYYNPVPFHKRTPLKAMVRINKNVSMFKACERCKYNSHCRQRVKLGVHVACENADEKDVMRYNVSPFKSEIEQLLQEGLRI